MFKDSLGFLPASLDSLVRSTKYSNGRLNNNWEDHFKITHKNNEYIKSIDDLDLLTEKGIYPYDFMDDIEKFKLKQLPRKSKFYSRLSEERMKYKDYQKAKHIWEHFNMQNFGEYHNLYLKTDVLLLADIFENFRNKAMEIYGLDPAHYYTSPGFSFDAMLKYTQAELELLHDGDMYNMIEQGIRGGICQVSKKHLIANNTYLKNYDKNATSNYLMYLDANNLYGLAMSAKLPYNKFKWNTTIIEK